MAEGPGPLELVPREALIDELVRRSDLGCVVLEELMGNGQYTVRRRWWGNPYHLVGLAHSLIETVLEDTRSNVEALPEDE